WQTKQVVRGDFSQRVKYMEEFSSAFNALVEQLAAMTNELQIQQDELIRRNDTLICEVEERERAEQAEREQRQLAEAMVAAAKALNATLDLDEVMDIMLEKIADVVPYDSAVILQVEGNTAFTRRAKNYQRYGKDIETQVNNARFNLIETPNLYTLITTMQPYVITDVNQYAGWNKNITNNPVRSWLGTPVIAHGKVIALFSLDKLEPGFYTEVHAQKLKMFASHAALALENARLYQEVQRLAITDALTGLYNRRFFFERAVQELDRSRRYHHPLAIMMMDLDHFKKVNDKFGHPAGDLVLETIAQIARKQLRQSDIAARFGGEEFIFLLPETTPQQAEKIADRLRLSIAEYSIPYEGKIITVTASFGI
ncbi:MAG: sensor domain-containing diguanylate cyclase, partial [Anaerolineales bacterium]